MPKQAYYAARAIAERRQSQAATDPRAAAVHAEMSARYEALASDPSLELPSDDPASPEPTAPDLADHDKPANDFVSAEDQPVWNPTD